VKANSGGKVSLRRRRKIIIMIVETLSIAEKLESSKNVEELVKTTALAMEDWRLMLPVRAKNYDGIALGEQTEHARANSQ
jgi:hypothetical protein